MTQPVEYTLTETGIVREVTTGDRSNKETRDIVEFITNVSKHIPFDTGWMPVGLRSWTQADNHAQFVYQCPPGVNLIYWGEHEGGGAEVYRLAQPWRIVIGDFLNGELYGARIFYSPQPVNSPEQPLYHANLPNINCKGYNGDVGVGWVCLYHNESIKHKTIGEKVLRTLERVSGGEAFNNANMRGTDGPRFYQAEKKPSYIWDPREWEKKTEQSGVEWTLDQDLWIPILVTDRDDQRKHNKSGVPLTVEMAMNGKYNAYYHDKAHPKPYILTREKRLREDSSIAMSIVNSAFVASGPTKTKNTKNTTKETKKVKMTYLVECSNCGAALANNTAEIPLCPSCVSEQISCYTCGVSIIVDHDPVTWVAGFNNDLPYCEDCVTELCVCPLCEEPIYECITITKPIESGELFVPEGCICSHCRDSFGIAWCLKCNIPQHKSKLNKGICGECSSEKENVENKNNEENAT